MPTPTLETLAAAVAALGSRLDKLDGGGRPDPSPHPLPAKPAATPTPAPAPTTAAPAVVVLAVRDGSAAHFRVPDAMLEAAGDERHRVAWRWDFGGDVRHQPRRVEGFNAACVYAAAGTYDVSLNGSPFARVLVAADARPDVVAADFASLAKAASVPDALVLLAPPGGVLDCPGTLTLADGVELYAAGPAVTLLYAAEVKPKSYPAILRCGKRNVLRGLAFDTPAAGTDYTEVAAVVAGDDLTVFDCVAGDVDWLVQGNAKPARVYVGGGGSRDAVSLRAYLGWAEGEQWVFAGATVANSTREHVVRAGGVRFVSVVACDFGNLDRRAKADGGDGSGDKDDYAKTTVNLQGCVYGGVWGCTLRAVAETGPLAYADGRAEWLRYADNVFIDGGFLRVRHGSRHVAVDDNDFAASATGQDAQVGVEAYSAKMARGVEDFSARGNVNTAAGKQLVHVYGDVAGRLDLADNAGGKTVLDGKCVPAFPAPPAPDKEAK